MAGYSVFIGTGKFLALVEVHNIRGKSNPFKQARTILIWLLQKSEFLSFLNVFQKSTLSLMLYLADNLAYIPYTVVDEPLYVIHQIDIMISVSGSNLLQTFKEVSCPSSSTAAIINLYGPTQAAYRSDLLLQTSITKVVLMINWECPHFVG